MFYDFYHGNSCLVQKREWCAAAGSSFGVSAGVTYSLTPFVVG